MIDNYDSFTFNVAQYFIELGADVKVVRNDELTVESALQLNPERIVISPGPCTPNEAGISMDVIKACAGRVPVLGVCLGCQCIAQVFGGAVVGSQNIMHGKVSSISHKNTGVFNGLPTPFKATRYHSLVVASEGLPEVLEVTAWSQDQHGHHDEIMGLKHKTMALEGVQFHPESILSECGHSLLANFLELKE